MFPSSSALDGVLLSTKTQNGGAYCQENQAAVLGGHNQIVRVPLANDALLMTKQSFLLRVRHTEGYMQSADSRADIA